MLEGKNKNIGGSVVETCGVGLDRSQAWNDSSARSRFSFADYIDDVVDIKTVALTGGRMNNKQSSPRDIPVAVTFWPQSFAAVCCGTNPTETSLF